MLYTMNLDHNHYLAMAWDRKQIAALVGDMRTSMEKRIDMWNTPRSYEGVFNETLRVSFPKTIKEDKHCVVPDLATLQGRLFINARAYEVLEPHIAKDGEFLPVTYEQEGDAYVYTPLRVAEDVKALDTTLSKKNEWGDVEHLAFHEDKVNNWALFRTEYNRYGHIYCHEVIKTIIEQAGLTGLYFSNDLANIFPEERGDVADLN